MELKKWGKDGEGPMVGDDNLVAENLAEMIWRLAENNPALRMKVAMLFLNDLEAGYKSRKELYEDKKRNLAFDQEYLEEKR